MPLQDLTEIVQSGGLVSFLLFLLWAVSRDRPLWVTGREYRDLLERYHRMEQVALRGTKTAEKATEVVKTTVGDGEAS